MRARGVLCWAIWLLLLALSSDGVHGQAVTLGAGTTVGAGVNICPFIPVVPQLPMPPSYATFFNNLQIQGGTQGNTNPGIWTINTSQSGSTGPCSTCGATMTFGVASPSLSGGSMKIESTNTSTTSNFYWNALFFRHLTATMSSGTFPPTHFETDFWVYYVAGQNVQCYEYDPDMYDAGGEYFMSMQFCAAGSNTANLHLYSKIAPGWKTTTFARPSLTAGVWHHIQTYGTMNPTTSSQYPYGSYTYIEFIYDGAIVYNNLNLTYGAGQTNFGSNTNIEMQLDSRPPQGGVAPGAITEYLDKYNAVFW